MAVAITLGIVGFLLAGAGVVLGILALRCHRQASLLGTPLARAGKVRPGLRRVKGHLAASGELLKSPLGNKPCVYYRLRVSEERRQWKSSPGAPEPNPGGMLVAGLLGGLLGASLYRAFGNRGDDGNTRSVRSWEVVLDESRCAPAVVRDDTGAVDVDLSDADVVPKDPTRFLADLSRPFPVRLGDFLAKKHRIFTVDDRGRVKTMMVVEETLAEGAKVTVLGTVETDDAGKAFFQAAEGDPLLVSEADLTKQARSARSWAVGLSTAAAGTLLLGLVALALGVFLAARAA